MTPKEKAQELFQKFNTNISFEPKTYNHRLHMGNAKQCAIIAVDEIIEYLPRKKTNTHLWYWKEVNQEIKKL